MKEQLLNKQNGCADNSKLQDEKQYVPQQIEQNNNHRASSLPHIEKKYKKRINLIKQINKIQLQQVMVAYKPQDSPQVAKRDSKEFSSPQGIKNFEKHPEQQHQIKESSFKRGIQLSHGNKTLKDSKNLTEITSKLNGISKVKVEEKEAGLPTFSEQTNKNGVQKNQNYSQNSKNISNDQLDEQTQVSNLNPFNCKAKQDTDFFIQSQNMQNSIIDKSQSIQKENLNSGRNIQENYIVTTLKIQNQIDESNNHANEGQQPLSPQILSNPSSYSNLCSYSHIDEEEEGCRQGDLYNNKPNCQDSYEKNKWVSNQVVKQNDDCQNSNSSSLSQSFQMFEQGIESPLTIFDNRQECSFDKNNENQGRKQVSRNQQHSSNKEKTISSTLDVSCNNQNEQVQEIRKSLQSGYPSSENINSTNNYLCNQLIDNTSENSQEALLYKFQQIKQEIPFIKLSELSGPKINQQIEYDNKDFSQKKIDGQESKIDKKNLSQYVKVIRHRKIVCNSVSNKNKQVNQSLIVQVENNNDNIHDQGISITSPQTTNGAIRKRVLSQQGPTNQKQQTKEFFNSDEYHLLISQQKSLTPVGYSSKKQDESLNNRRKQLNKVDGVQLDKFQDKIDLLQQKEFKINVAAADNRFRANQFQKENNAKTSLSPRKNTSLKSSINHTDSRVSECRRGKKEEFQNKKFTQIQQEQPTLKKSNNIINQDERELDQISNNQTQINQYLTKQQEFLEQIDSSYITPSSVKDIMQGIQLRSKALSNNQFSNNKTKKNFKISSNPIKASSQQTNTLTSTKKQKEEQKENRDTISSRQSQSDKPNKKIRSKTLLANQSLNIQQLNFKDDSFSNIQKNTPVNIKKIETDTNNLKQKPPQQPYKTNNSTPKANQNSISLKQNADLNERYTRLLQQLNLDSKIRDIKNLIETCQSKRRNSLMKPKSKQVRFLEDEELDENLQYSKEI